MEGLRPQWAVKAMLIIIIASILFRCVSAANHTVGGVSGWDLTSDLQAWTAQTTFHVGDSLVFSYTPVHDVVEVKEEDYEGCEASNPIKTYNDGETVISLSEQGRRYFICGRQGHCRMGLKLNVEVVDLVPLRGGGSRSSPPPPRSFSPPSSNSYHLRPCACSCSAPEAAMTSFFWLIMPFFTPLLMTTRFVCVLFGF